VDAHRLLADLEAFALSLPGAWADTPWEDDQVSKVAKKIFVFYGTGQPPAIGVKLPESNAHALTLPGAAPSGYGLGRHGWVNIPLDGLDGGDAEVLFDFVEESYRAVAPKKLVAELDARGG
jgi:predicted DNA-binding protein (MmcQ/YjbR family)